MKLKKIFIGMLIGCISACSTVYARESLSELTSYSPPSIAPFSLYYYYGTAKLTRGDGYVSAIITTTAYTTVSHIYHDVSIFVNGSEYLNQRYHCYNKAALSTTIDIPASKGDVISVAVKHYTAHNGITESGNSSQTITY